MQQLVEERERFDKLCNDQLEALAKTVESEAEAIKFKDVENWKTAVQKSSKNLFTPQQIPSMLDPKIVESYCEGSPYFFKLNNTQLGLALLLAYNYL